LLVSTLWNRGREKERKEISGSDKKKGGKER
jgi:hypothetical protein